MTDPLLRRVIVPIANKEDTKATCAALRPHLDDSVDLVNVLYVIEQTEGYMDPASPEALKQEAGNWFESAETTLDTGDAFETELRAGSDIVAEIVASATEHDATAIVFKPRQSSGLLSQLFSRDLKDKLLSESPCPVVSLPDTDGDNLTEVSK
ncbi:universal stress protein [Natranaeroarchaeum aerophilus]|uniref:Universal stress protein n=1 Tax=Natranaeroarchaeum aerophilus TaxID=2917711 RepID=A0AAE3FU70_9EURY|nr:universal stress protein [Natranaeroarchaeum aerophilus]MCL9815205.1 universal stress protein [Natranaeroarchaeum aerophilus]